jgi:hypothetical protein
MNSRLESMCPVNQGSGHYRQTLKQERHKTPRSPHISPVRLPECCREGGFLDGYAVRISSPQAGQSRGQACPISKHHAESQQSQEGSTVGRVTNIAIRSYFNYDMATVYRNVERKILSQNPGRIPPKCDPK